MDNSYDYSELGWLIWLGGRAPCTAFFYHQGINDIGTHIMVYKIILFLNLIAIAIVIYLLASYVKHNVKDKRQQKNQDDAMQ